MVRQEIEVVFSRALWVDRLSRVDGSKDGDHDKESQRRSCDARLLGKGGAYAIITKPIARILKLMQCVARGVGWASLHTSKRA